MNNTEFLEKLSTTNQSVKGFVKELIDLPKDKLTIKPSAEEWSILECIDHMNKATELYIDQIEEKIDHLRPSRKEQFKKTWLANKFTKMLAPTEQGEIKSKMKTLAGFVPHSNPDTTVVGRFLNNCDRIEKILKKANNNDLRSFKVTTALGPILKFYIGDALDFILTHNQRHVIQVKNTLSVDSAE